MKYDLKEKKISRTVIDTEKIQDGQEYSMELVSGTGIIKAKLVQSEPFSGFRPKMEVTLEIKNEQKTIEESIKDDGPLASKKPKKEETVDYSLMTKKSRKPVHVIKGKKK